MFEIRGKKQSFRLDGDYHGYVEETGFTGRNFSPPCSSLLYVAKAASDAACTLEECIHLEPSIRRPRDLLPVGSSGVVVH